MVKIEIKVYSYNCEICGNRIINSPEVYKCEFCQKKLCLKHHRDGYCTEHYAFLTNKEQKKNESVYDTGPFSFSKFLISGSCFFLLIGLIFAFIFEGKFWIYGLILGVGGLGLFSGTRLRNWNIKRRKRLNALIKERSGQEPVPLPKFIESEALNNGTAVLCPHCGYPMAAETQFCGKCGQEISKEN